MQQPTQVLLAADQVQKKSRSKKSKAAQSTEDTSEPAENQENIANNASPTAESAAESDNTMQALSRCVLTMLTCLALDTLTPFGASVQCNLIPPSLWYTLLSVRL